MKQIGFSGQQSGYERHIQDLIDTHLPLLEMLISRLISRNPQCCQTIASLKHEQKFRKEKSSTFPIYKGIVSMYAPEGWKPGKGGVINTPIIIAVRTWFAEKIDILDLLSKHSSLFTDFDANEDSVFTTVVGSPGLAMFQGIFIDHLLKQFTGFNMPWNMGLNTEAISDAKLYQRLQT